MTQSSSPSYLPSSPDGVVAELLPDDRCILLIGEMGSGKSTLAAGVAASLADVGRTCWCLSADPGSPAFGPPGALSLARWDGGAWELTDIEALCSLDAARYRLPLVQALARLMARLPRGTVLIDAPGVVRGIAGAELLTGLAQASEPDAVVVFVRENGKTPLASELDALGRVVHRIRAHPRARRPGKRQRSRHRTGLWEAYLGEAGEQVIDLGAVHAVGAPPPPDVPAAWPGRQCALLDGGRTLALGEVLGLDGGNLRVRLAPPGGAAHTLLVRDARRGEGELLETAKPFAAAEVRYFPSAEVGSERPAYVSGPRPAVRSVTATATLVNGVFGDPLLHIRLRHQKRSLLFDLGDPGRLPARLAHQVSDVFISHAHMDHIGGFLWLLRSRMGPFPACRLYGPPGLADHIAGMIRGVLWDRIGEGGPEFRVTELHGDTLVRSHIRVGRDGYEREAPASAAEGILLHEPGFRVRAVTLDHGTPVLAFAFEPARQLNVRKERLLARGLDVGPWLGLLKQRILAGEAEAVIALPDGSEQSVATLAEDLVLIKPGEKLAYATDLADTPDNRERLIALANGAYAFFCEASFAEADIAQARRTGHLTGRASAEIATSADVQRYIPFHFSRRYEKAPQMLFDEIAAACSRTVLPRDARAFEP